MLGYHSSINSRKKDYEGHEPISESVTDSPSAPAAAHKKKRRVPLSKRSDDGVAGLDLPEPAIPDALVLRKNPDEDDFGYKALVEVLTSPVVYGYFRYALRTTAFVAFPLYTLGSHPNTQDRLGVPQLLVASVISFSISKDTFGSHAGAHSWAWHSLVYMLIFGSVGAALHLYQHIGAWYGYVGTGIFCASLCANSSIRRFLYIFFYVHMMMLRFEEYTFGFVKSSTAAWFASDMFIGSLIGLAATLFPYPVLIRSTLDSVITKLFGGLGNMILGMEVFVASPDVCAAEAFFNDHGPLERMEAGLAHMPPLLWFANWEPLEFPLRNPIRRLKLALLRRLIALTYAAFECGRTIVGLKKEIARQKDIEQLREARRAACGSRPKTTKREDEKTGGDRKTASAKGPSSSAEESSEAGEVMDEEKGKQILEENTHENAIHFVKTLSQCVTLVGATESKPAALLKAIPFTELVDRETHMRRNFRMEMLQLMYVQGQRVAADREYSKRENEATVHAEQDGVRVTNKWTAHLSPEEHQLVLSYQDSLDEIEIFLSLQRVFFRMLLGMIASELVAFEETMKSYTPNKSLCGRLVDFFIVEPWEGFWQAIWEQLTLATPQHVRIVKDAVKMTCAFLVACVFNYEIWIPQGGMYFFGVTTVLGMPVEEETVTTMICRAVGNTIGCALGYLAANNTHTYAQMIATTMCFAFLCRLVSHHSMFGAGFAYAGTITLAMAASGTNPLEVLSRIVAGIYCALAYSLCCMLIFPTNPVKILWGYRVKLSRSFSDLLDDVAESARLPLGGDGDAAVAAQSNRLCSQMNVQLKLVKRMLDMCAKWTPFGAGYPMIRGAAKFPGPASSNIHKCQTRLVANFEILVFNIQLLRRPREEPVNSVVARTFAGPLSALLHDLAGAVRLLCQDYIDSLQHSRQFSNPAFLMHMSYLVRMRLRLRSIMYECYVFLSDLSKGLGDGMTVEDYDAIRAERDRRRTEEENDAAALAGAPDTSGLHAFTLRGLAEERAKGHTNGNPNEVQVAVEEGHASHDAGPPEDNPAVDNPLVDLQDCIDTNASFADRYLLRQALSSAAPSPTEGNLSARCDGGGVNPNSSIPSTTTSFARRRAFRFQAPLQEEHGEPQGSYPMGPEDARRHIHQQLKRERDQQDTKAMPGSTNSSFAVKEDPYAMYAGDGTPDHSRSFPNASTHDHRRDTKEGDQSASLAFPPVAPQQEESKLGRVVSGLVKDAALLDPPLLPPYQGPNFSYHEDVLESPVDTDFMALVAILSSCEGIIAELQRMAPGVAETSAYQKQLHETTSCLKIIDTVSKKLVQRRKEVYERYHDPPAALPGGLHPALNAQTDLWREWRF